MVSSEVKAIAKRYLDDVNDDFAFSKVIMNKVGYADKDMVEFVNSSAIISICIKYESFTADTMRHLKRRRSAYNKPWAYTRYFINIFQLDVKKEYEDAHDAWEYYNALKHENHKSEVEKTKFVQKHNIKSSQDALDFVHRVIGELLKKFAY